MGLIIHLFGLIAIFTLAVGFTIWELFRLAYREKTRPRWIFLCAVLFVLGFAWQQVFYHQYVKPIGIIYTENAQKEARVRRGGVRSYHLEIDTHHDPITFYLASGIPDKAFWMRNDQSIGIEYDSGFKDIIEVELNIKSMSKGLTKLEQERVFSRLGLSPSDIAEFEAAKQQAQRLGLLWTKQQKK